MRSSYLDYAMSVIVGRALPDVRDGLKPVHRRILYSMYDSGLQPGRPHRKCANVVGGVMGNYHPHGDSAIYDALVRLGQDFAMRYPLIDPQGNFGSIDNDSPAAMRYTEARLSRLATEMLRDIDADTVEFGPNYDESRQEPLVLPARFPNLLVNGSSGIAVGMATNIPPHNLREAIDAVVAYIDDPRHRRQGPDEAPQGPRLPDRRHHRRARRDPRRVRDRPRPRGRARQGPHRADGARQGAHHRHRDALPGLQGRRARRRQRPDAEDRRAGPERPAQGDLGPARRVRQVGHPARDRAEARRDPEGRPQQALQAHPAPDHLRREHGRPRRRRAADARPAADRQELRRPPDRHHRAAHEVRAAREGGPPPHPRGPARRDREHRRGHRADPRLERPGRGARRPDGALRAHAHPGPGDPRPAPPAPHRAPDQRDQDRARRRGRAHQVAARHPRRRGQGHGR